ncbi:hypothetical protein BDW59DRAFT_138379 [Aspergillus cavernicola]|uniref:Uncharacterized protein n=1 Tax=Aspergillus cavernicola TaxID=176166 RepID=A0ABR4IZN3_9EURO
MRMSRPTTLLHLLLGLRTSASTTLPTSTSTSILRSPHPPALLQQQCFPTNLYIPLSNPFLKTKPFYYYSTMSQPPHDQPDSTPASKSNSNSEAGENKSTPLALPSTSSTTIPQLDVNGDGVKLDHLGPLIVNVDGTLARISNWAQMTEIERGNTVRILGKRNKLRMEALKNKETEGGKEGEE